MDGKLNIVEEIKCKVYSFKHGSCCAGEVKASRKIVKSLKYDGS